MKIVEDVAGIEHSLFLPQDQQIPVSAGEKLIFVDFFQVDKFGVLLENNQVMLHKIVGLTAL